LEAQSAVDYSALSPEDLVAACLQPGDEFAWTEFVRRFQPLIARVVYRVARQWGSFSPDTVEELIQETYLKLCADGFRALRGFKAVREGGMFGYIKVFTANLVHDHFKGEHSQKRGGNATTVTVEDSDEGPIPLRSSGSTADCIEQEVLVKEIDDCLRQVASGRGLERDRKLFWLYYRVGLTASAIAALPGIDLSTKGVESALLRLTRLVRQRLVTRCPDSSKQPLGEEGIQSTEAL
jgi:RNA polymerase sigma-70 factor (ECF subfamily)